MSGTSSDSAADPLTSAPAETPGVSSPSAVTSESTAEASTSPRQSSPLSSERSSNVTIDDKELFSCVVQNLLVRLRALVNQHGAETVVSRIVKAYMQRGEQLWATPLYFACSNGVLESATYLVEECGADVDVGAIIADVSRNELHLVSPLSVAASAGHAQIVSLLLRHGASLGPGKDLDTKRASAEHVVGDCPEKPNENASRPESDTDAMLKSSDDLTNSEKSETDIASSSPASRGTTKAGSSSKSGARSVSTTRKERLYDTACRDFRREHFEGSSVHANVDSYVPRLAKRSPGAIEHAFCHDCTRFNIIDRRFGHNLAWHRNAAGMSMTTDLLLSQPSVLKDWSTISDPEELAECPLYLAVRSSSLLHALKKCLETGITLGPDTPSRLLIEASAWGNFSAVQYLLQHGADVMYRSEGSMVLDIDHLRALYFGREAANENVHRLSGGDGSCNADAQDLEMATDSDTRLTAPKSGSPMCKNNYTALLAVCSHVVDVEDLTFNSGGMFMLHGYDPVGVAKLLLEAGASVTARDGSARTSLWHVGAATDGGKVDHPPKFEMRKYPPFRDTYYRLYAVLQSYGAVGYMGPGAPSSMLMNSSSVDSAEDDDIADYHDAYGNNIQNCAICLEPLSTGACTGHSGCNHINHVRCLERWQEKRDVCPQCSAHDSHMYITRAM